MNPIIEQKPSLDYLIHYGVQGMKWGVRRAKQEAKAVYKQAKKKALNNYSNKVDKIDYKYSRGEVLSKDFKGMSKENITAINKAYSDFEKELSNAKFNYKSTLKNIKNSPEAKAGRTKVGAIIGSSLGVATIAAVSATLFTKVPGTNLTPAQMIKEVYF